MFNKSSNGVLPLEIGVGNETHEEIESINLSDEEESVSADTSIQDFINLRTTPTDLSPSKHTTRNRDSMKSNSYSRPGKIKNGHLLVDKNPTDLKSCLTEMYDFVVLKYDAWQCFKNWYGVDTEIER